MNKNSLAAILLACACPYFATISCSAGNEDGETSSGGADSKSTTKSSGDTTTGTGPGSGGGFNTGGSGQGTGGFDECAGVTSTTTSEKQPADIIIAVDTSGSMSEESAEVQQNLNNFATIITNSGIDVHVVLIADANVCIPAPLGSGSCGGADELLPGYRHVVQTVNSNDALQVILNTYPQWQPSLRANATKTFLVVTDDNSDMSAADFTNQLLALDPPTFQGFLFHGIVANSDVLDCFGFTCPNNPPNPCCYSPGPIGCDSYGAAEGTVYKQLTMQTMGITGDLCAQEFDPIFQAMAEGVITASQLSCEYPIPEPPMGETFNPAQTNVLYTPGGQMQAQPIYHVPGGVNDCGPMGGWYYDDPSNPTMIIVCPATCDILQGDTMGKVDVEFGCDTEEVPQ
jgi:hypothetical protein